MKSILTELLLQIHLYYPIGLPQLDTNYPGTLLLRSKIANKLNELANEKSTKWYNTVEGIGKANSGKLTDLSAIPSPSMGLDLELTVAHGSGWTVIKSLRLSLSVLTNCYTIFFIDSHKYDKYDRNLSVQAGSARIRDFVFLASSSDSADLLLVETVKKIVANQYKDYKFVPHEVLLNTFIVGGIPYYVNPEDYNPSSRHCIYEYLFADMFFRSEMEVYP